MKRILSIPMILLILLILATSFSFANPNSTIRMMMDGRFIDFPTVGLKVEGKVVPTDVPAVIHNNRTLVPIHVIRNMGITVEWQDATREVIITTDKQRVVMVIDSPIAIIDGQAKRLPSDVPPKIITYQNRGRTMVPIAFLRELGLKVNWNEATRTVEVERNTPLDDKSVVTKAVKDINISLSAGFSEVRIKTGEELAYTKMELTDQAPFRFVFDFQNTKFDFTNKSKLQSNGIFRLPVNDYGIREIRGSQFQVNPFITRVTIEVEEIMPYRVFYDSTTGEMVIQLEVNTKAKALDYRVIAPNSSRLELRATDVIRYQFSVSDYGRTLHVTVPKNYIDLPITTIEIGDQFLQEINIGEVLGGNDYHIEIRLQDNVEYRSLNPINSREYFIEFKLANSNKVPLIVIDPGHGGTDPGAIANGIMEKELVLDISQRLNKLLIEAGFRTYMTRIDDSSVSLIDRAGVANQLQADLFVSIHANAASNPNANGIENLYYPSEKNPNDFRDNKKLAEIFQREMVRILGANNRGIIPRENLYVLRETHMPAVITEVGFLTNPQEAAKLSTSEYRQQVAEAIYQSILKYFEEIK